MLGNLRLRQIKHALEMADAERPVRQEVDDPEPGRIAEALVNLDEFHGGDIFVFPNIRQFEFIEELSRSLLLSMIPG